jgi:hypothetical protein
MSGELAATLAEVAVYVRRYVVLTEAQLVAVVLWIAHTHAIDAAEQSPYLAITSATKRSGKTRLHDVLEQLVARPWRVISPSEAVVFRKLAAARPTLLLDEVDAIWSGNGSERHEGLRAILNSGNRRGTVVPRCAGPQGTQLVDFAVFGPKALAGIGRLPDTVADRAIPIRLRRRTPTETVERFRQREAAEAAEPLARSLASVVHDLIRKLAAARPALPDELDDRAADGWEPLLAIADAAGGDWPQCARRAAVELSGEQDEQDDAIPLRLLADVHAVFEARGTDRIATVELLEALAEDAEAPWATWHRGERMSPRALADLLRPFSIRSRTIRLDDETPKGYMRESFEDAWSRYMPPQPPTSGLRNATPPQPASAKGLSGACASATSESVADGQRDANPH